MNKTIKIIILLSLIILNLFFLNNYIITDSIPIKRTLNKLNLKNVNNLMIVAHPDDESLWGGVHLSKSDYLVVCVTCGEDKKRQKEFNNAVKEFGNVSLSLNYPDITNNEINIWSKDYYKIENDLKTIINYKDWKTIVTHNPNGEFDHPHHKMISTMISKNSNKEKLYYFNKLYTKEELDNINYCLKSINDKENRIKNLLLDNYSYKSQLTDDYGDNIIYENFISYNNWR